MQFSVFFRRLAKLQQKAISFNTSFNTSCVWPASAHAHHVAEQRTVLSRHDAAVSIDKLSFPGMQRLRRRKAGSAHGALLESYNFLSLSHLLMLELSSGQHLALPESFDGLLYLQYWEFRSCCHNSTANNIASVVTSVILLSGRRRSEN